MTIPVITLDDTFDEWRIKNNQTAANIGDVDNLVTTSKEIVGSINESIDISQNNSIVMAIALG